MGRYGDVGQSSVPEDQVVGHYRIEPVGVSRDTGQWIRTRGRSATELLKWLEFHTLSGEGADGDRRGLDPNPTSTPTCKTGEGWGTSRTVDQTVPRPVSVQISYSLIYCLRVT